MSVKGRLIPTRIRAWLCFALFILSMGAAQPCKGMGFFMKTELSDHDSKQLENMADFNQSIRTKGWSLSGKIIKQKQLDHLQLSNSKWHDVDVVSSSLTEATFKNCTFEQVTFKQSDLSQSTFENCVFIECKFVDTKVMEAVFKKSEFRKCEIELSNFNSTTLSETSFKGLKTDQVEWRYAKFKDVRFHQCDLKETGFTDGELENTHFEACSLYRSGFSASRLNACTFNLQGDFVNFVETHSTNITITGQAAINDLNLSKMKGSHIIVQNMDWSEMFSMSLAQVDHFRLENAKLRYASSMGTTFTDTVFKNVRFDYAQFEQNIFNQTSFENITFSGEIIFDDSKFKDTQFTHIQKSESPSISFKNTIYDKKMPF